MNFLKGSAGDDAVEVPGLKRSIPTGVALPAAGQAVSVGLRPEHLTIDPDGDTHSVELTEALGGVSYAYLVSDTGEKLIVEERGDVRSRTGDRVGLSFDPARAFLFDAETEARLR
jgi:lactose/L-arabinose transport system ATP-binding protein